MKDKLKTTYQEKRKEKTHRSTIQNGFVFFRQFHYKTFLRKEKKLLI